MTIKMQTLKINRKNFKDLVQIIIKSIKQGKVVVCPTDTVYGLICNAENKTAVRKIFKIKKRNFQKPISLFVKDFKAARRVAIIGKNQGKFLNKLWPGKLIAVLEANPSMWLRAGRKFPRGIVCRWGKIGLRIPNHKLLVAILNKFKNPLAQTSANISGKPASTRIEEVLNQFGKQRILPDLVIDAGNLKHSKQSKVIDLTEEKPKTLRK